MSCDVFTFIRVHLYMRHVCSATTQRKSITAICDDVLIVLVCRVNNPFLTVLSNRFGTWHTLSVRLGTVVCLDIDRVCLVCRREFSQDVTLAHACV